MNNKTGRRPEQKTERAPGKERRAVKNTDVPAGKAPPSQGGYGRYYAPVAAPAPAPVKSPAFDLSKTLAPILAELNAQKSEIDALKKRLMRVEANQKNERDDS
ncbi:MAG: hypothetical protein ACRYFS_22415 [Janthinobacterium lividum]